MKRNLSILMRSVCMLAVATFMYVVGNAQNKIAAVKVNSNIAFQKITGFGGGNSPYSVTISKGYVKYKRHASP